MKTTNTLRATALTTSVALLLMLSLGARPGRADGTSSTELELQGLADRAKARQASIESQLAAASDPAEKARLEDLSARNSKVIAAYGARISGSTGSTAEHPAAPDSTGGGGMFSGLMDKAKGMFGGGDATNPAGPESQSFMGADGSVSAGSIGGYLKNNWGSLAGGMAGSIAGGMIASRLAGGNKLAGIAGSLVGGWLGGKVGTMVQNMIQKKSSGGANPAAQPPASQQGGTPYAGGGGGYTAPGVQITYPANYRGVPAVAPAHNLSEARELMTGRYQAFLAAGSNPTLQATAYQNYMQSKTQYEQMLAQSRAAAQ